MWENIKSKVLAFLSFACFLLFGVILYEKNKNDKLQTEVEDDKLKLKDQPLELAINQQKAAVEQEKTELTQEKPPVAQEGSPNENSDYWNKKD